METIVDDRGIFGPEDRSTMRNVFKTKVETTETAVSHDYMKDGWPDNERIDRILEGSEEELPQTFRTAMRLVRQRFGCVYKKLPDELRHNAKLLMEATIESSGHELAHASEDMRANLLPEFFIEAMQRGARGWIIKWASDAVKSNKEVQRLAVTDHPANADYLDEYDEDIEALKKERLKELEIQANGDGH